MAGALAFSMAGCGDGDGNGALQTADGGGAEASAVDAGASPDAMVVDVPDAASVGDAVASPGDGGSSPDGTVVDSGPIGGRINLALVPMNATAAAVAGLVGVYTGNLGIWAPTDGKPARYTDACTITVGADGTLTVRASDQEISGTLNGDELDTLLSPNRDDLSRSANTVDRVGNDTHTVTVTVMRGFVTSAIANVRTVGDQALNNVTCYVRNPNPTNVRAGVGDQGATLRYGGATAADLNSAWIGTYTNGTCTVTLSGDGTMHLTKGTADVTARMAGDADSEWGDTLEVTPSGIELHAGELLVSGVKNSVRMQKNDATWQGFARTGADVLVAFGDCKGLVKP